MKRIWQWVVVNVMVAVLLGACSARERSKIQGSPADPNNLPNIVNTYAVNGFDPDGVEFGGTVSIRDAGGGEYVIDWIVTGALLRGRGRIEGNQLLVTWESMDERQHPVSGTGTYTITDRGELFGERYLEGNPTPGTENLFPNN